MPERRRELKTYEVRMGCEDTLCDGEMKADGITYTSYPQQYPHTCDMCGMTDVYSKSYPCIEHEVIPDLIDG